KHPLREALADDHDAVTVRAVGVREVPSGDQRDAEHREEPWRDNPETRVRILLAVGGRVTIAGELKAGRQPVGVTPWYDGPHRHAVDARQLADAFRHLLVGGHL